ncbi:MAG TPA: histidine kinase, partial [Candidatus Sulfomarinibacteraceae bacterium]|nr:histidine kinase [Candidatus Sulfomarinibacteraceae bacterium]
LFFLVLLPLTLLLLLVATGSSILHQRAMRTLVGERDERAARAAAAAVSEQLEQRAVAVEAVAQRAAQMENPAQALVDVGPLLPSFEYGLALFSPEGTLLTATGTQEAWQTVFSTLASLATDDHRAGEAAFFATPFSAAGAINGSSSDPLDQGQRTLIVAARVDGFTAAGGFSPSALARNALSRIFGSGDAGAAAVITDDGDLIYRAGPPLLEASTILQHPGVISALRGESGTTYFSGDEGEHVVAFSPITPVGWALVIEEPWQRVTDPFLRTTEWAPLVLAPLLLISLVGLGFSVLQIVQPLQSLEEKATALAWGDFEAIEEPVGGIAEIQRLQVELVHMAQKVRSAQRGLRDYLGAITAGLEEERRRLARDLHDDTIQSLIALNQRIQLVQLTPQDGQTVAQLNEMQQMVSQLISDLRRTIHALRPIYLEDLGLAPALKMLVQEVCGATNIAIRFQLLGTERRLPAEVELALYRIAQEALNNVCRHSAANAALIELRFAAEKVALTIEDSGRGFVVPESPAELVPRRHYGLLGIHERSELIGAHLALESQPGKGTRLQVTLPT